MTTTTRPAWQQRFLAPRLTVPRAATLRPNRCVHTSNETGVMEVWTWDADTGQRRQVTDRPNGTGGATIDPTGEWIWWYADTDGDELGVWMRQRWDGGPDEVAVPDLGPAYSTGIAFTPSGRVVIGSSTTGGTTVHVATPGANGTATLIYQHEQDATPIAVSADDSILVLNHSEHGDSAHPELRAMRLDGTTIADLWDGPGRGLYGVGFTAVAGDNRFLAVHERQGSPRPLLWDPTGDAHEITVDLPGDVGVDWYPDGSALLLRHDDRARSSLHRLSLADGALSPVSPRDGVVGDGAWTEAGRVGAAQTRPDGSVWFVWSSSQEAWQLRSTAGPLAVRASADPPPPSAPAEDVDADGPGGPVHALVQRPAGEPPYPTVFLVHGGPTWHDRDDYNPTAAAWVDGGFLTVRVNYRGSTGYGVAWRDALLGRIGTTELEDITAVREELQRRGLVDPDRLVIAGGSWGGFVTLYAIGREPEVWKSACAAVPVADLRAAYEDEMEPLRVYDRMLIGGAPDDVPDKYVACSPLTYIDDVRTPVLILAGVNDPRCPIRQIENYIAALEQRGLPHEVYRFEAGHGSLIATERMNQIGAMVDFARRTLGMS